MPINFFQQVKFTHPLTLQDCGSPVLLTVSPTYWSDCEWEGDRLEIYLESEYQDFICHIQITCSRLKKHCDGGFYSHENRVLWSYMYIIVLWRMEDQLRNQFFGREWNLSRTNSMFFFSFLLTEEDGLFCFVVIL